MKIGHINEKQVQDGEARKRDKARRIVESKDIAHVYENFVPGSVEMKVTQSRHLYGELDYLFRVNWDPVKERRRVLGAFESSPDNFNTICLKKYLLWDRSGSF